MMGDRWRRLGYETPYNNFILTWNHGLRATDHLACVVV